MSVSIEQFTYETLSKEDLYAILQLRTEVFVVEQNCPYQECDGNEKNSWHYLIRENERIAAYTRLILPQNGKVKIGRVVVKAPYRMRGYGQLIMQKAIADYQQHFTTDQLIISAQCYLDRFYTDLGFEKTGNDYLEDGIPHQEMIWFQKD